MILVALFWSVFASSASAQESHTLRIVDGAVYVDGDRLSADQLPDSLDLDGVRAQYRFLGIERPVVEINGRLYAVDEGLRPVTRNELQEERSSVILRGNPIRKHATQGGNRLRSAQREYLDAVQRSSRNLYQRLVRERRMEREAQQLAQRIRMLPPGPKRQTRIDTLRAMLSEIFELKQENRRREIERLKHQIQEIQESIEQRSQMRSLMIDRRLRQLVDSTERR